MDIVINGQILILMSLSFFMALSALFAYSFIKSIE